MKIYTKVRIKIETGEVLEEEFFEYAGPVAECGSGGKGGSSVDYQSSPEQAAIYQAILPMVYQMSAQSTGIPYTYTPGSTGTTTSGTTTTSTGTTTPTSVFSGISGGGETDYETPTTTTTTTPATTSSGAYTITGMPAAPTAPTYPDMTGYLTGITAPDAIGYDVASYSPTGYETPDTSMLMPTQEWYDSLSGDYIEGLYSSYDEGYSQLLEALGASGVSGSAAGLSGAGGAAAGEYWSEASTNVLDQLWNMSYPGMSTAYAAELGANQWLAEQQTAADAYQAESQTAANASLADLQNYYASTGWQNALTEATQNYNNLLTQTGQQYESDVQSYWAPYQYLMSALGGTYPDAVVSDSADPLSSITDAGTSAALTYALMSGAKASSKRFKKNIKELGKVRGLSFIQFEYTKDAMKKHPYMTAPGTQYGFIAEEVAEVYPQAVLLDDQGRPEAINYPVLIRDLRG